MFDEFHFVHCVFPLLGKAAGAQTPRSLRFVTCSCLCRAFSAQATATLQLAAIDESAAERSFLVTLNRRKCKAAPKRKAAAKGSGLVY
jgi:hypothetical protein